jgi:hypothetical protein
MEEFLVGHDRNQTRFKVVREVHTPSRVRPDPHKADPGSDQGVIFSSARTFGTNGYSCQTRRTARNRGTVRGGDEQTLQQTYSPKEVQVAFKVLMTR